jgi:NodT family efflux transporter outer membrane factor (OMF) lipoprotein
MLTSPLPRKIFLIMFLWAILAAGCTKVGPDFVKPEVEVMPNWLEAQGYNQISSRVDDYRDWWRTFNDPVLDKLIQTAYQQNLPLQIAGVRVLGARAQLGTAVGNFYPQSQKATGTLTRFRMSEASPISGPGAPIYYWTDAVGLTGSWELDFWGKVRRGIESADAAWQASLADYDNALVSLTGDVATSYVLLRTLEKRLDIIRKNVEVQKQALRIATARWKGGTTSKRDVDQAQTILESTEAELPTLEGQIQQARNALSLLMGLPPGDLGHLLGLKSTIPAPPPLVAVGIPADLLRRRPDIRSAEFRAAAQCAQIGVAKANLFPSFSLSGTFGFQASDVVPFLLGNITNWQSRVAAAGPSFQWNLLNYGQITNQVRFQDAAFQELLLDYQNTVLKAQKEVEDALIAFLKAQQRAQKLAGAVAAAQDSYKLAILQYKEGITDFTTVLTAEQALLTQQDSLAVTLGKISSQLVGVYRAMGGGWQIREGLDVVPDAIKIAMAKRTNWGNLLSPAAHIPPPSEMPRSAVRLPDW